MEDDLDTRTLMLLLAGQLRDRVRTHPVSTLAGAATLGYVLGWSMPTTLYRTVASFAMRSIAMQLVGRLLGANDEEEFELDDELDLVSTPGDPRPVDVPPYVA